MKQTNTKIMGVVILVLIILNVATLTSIWYHHKQEMDGTESRKRGGAGSFLIKELGFDSAQKLAYQQLREQHQKDLRAIREQLKDGKEAYFGLLADSSVSEATIKASALKAAGMEQEIDIETFHHFQKVRALCTPEQKKKFDTIIKDVVKLMGPPMQQGPPPHGLGRRDDNRQTPPDGDRFPPPPDGNQPPPRQ